MSLFNFKDERYFHFSSIIQSGRRAIPSNPFMTFPSFTKNKEGEVLSLKEICGHKVNWLFDPRFHSIFLCSHFEAE